MNYLAQENKKFDYAQKGGQKSDWLVDVLQTTGTSAKTNLVLLLTHMASCPLSAPQVGCAQMLDLKWQKIRALLCPLRTVVSVEG
jgi:hypothetical protein